MRPMRVFEMLLAPFAILVYGGTDERLPSGLAPRVLALALTALLAAAAMVASHQCGRGA